MEKNKAPQPRVPEQVRAAHLALTEAMIDFIGAQRRFHLLLDQFDDLMEDTTRFDAENRVDDCINNCLDTCSDIFYEINGILGCNISGGYFKRNQQNDERADE